MDMKLSSKRRLQPEYRQKVRVLHKPKAPNVPFYTHRSLPNPAGQVVSDDQFNRLYHYIDENGGTFNLAK